VLETAAFVGSILCPSSSSSLLPMVAGGIAFRAFTASYEDYHLRLPGGLQLLVLDAFFVVALGLVLPLGRVAVAMLPSRPLRVSGIRGTIFPYRLVAIALGLSIAVLPAGLALAGWKWQSILQRVKISRELSAGALAAEAMARRAGTTDRREFRLC
jgi:hypothetical protein